MIYAVHRERDGDPQVRVDLIDPAPLDEVVHEVRADSPQPVELRRQRRGLKGGARRSLARLADSPLVGEGSVAVELLQAVARGLPGRVRDLSIRAEPDGRFVMTGIVSSYYSKQMAQHLAMEVIAPGDRLVNNIEVRSAG